ncbi:MAG: CNT family concentrative nucleoside transporter [Crocinitomix sp.]
MAFLSQGADQKFIVTGWYPGEIRGDWQHKGDSMTLSFVEPKSYSVDSIAVDNVADGEANIDFYENNQVVVSSSDGQMVPGIKSNLVLLEIANNTELAFSLEGKTHNYTRIQPEERSLSFWSILRGALGITALIVITFLFSSNRKRIDWALVAKGTALQIVIAILVLKVPFVESGFHWLSQNFVALISYTDAGVDFLFGQMGIGKVQPPLITFAVKVLPTIIFFSALMSALYYLGILQKIVYVFAWVMKKFMRLSGAESLAAAGNVFLGQTEAPLLVKPYLLGMTKSEMMCLMTGGMATIAGGVLAAYVTFLGGDDPVQQAFFAKHLLTASIISAPAAIVAAKILIPETEEINENLKIEKQKIGTNLLEAISNGTTDGLKLAVNVGAMLIVFTALMALGNGILSWAGDTTGLNSVIAENTPYSDGLSFQFILGYIGAPIVWLIGVEGPDIVAVGELLGQKTVLNEFIAYPRLGEMREAGTLSQKSIIISTYMLCGFANFASIGIQIGGIGSLVPSRKGLLSKLGMRALLAGTVASLMTAAIVGMLY